MKKTLVAAALAAVSAMVVVHAQQQPAREQHGATEDAVATGGSFLDSPVDSDALSVFSLP